MRLSRQNGFTLIEIIVTIIVLAVAATAILGVFSSTVRTSANPMIQQQALSIAEAYMEEISLKAFVDPGGPTTETRATFDNVMDYHNLDTDGNSNGVEDGAHDQNGALIPGLAAYTITVNVGGAALNGIANTDAWLIQITVDHPAVDPITIQSFRTNY